MNILDEFDFKTIGFYLLALYQYCPFQEQITWSILSRRSKYRTGTRFFVRGSDDNGNVANFCETEQILEKRSAGLLASYVQTRGSMPMKWTQTPDIHYKPKVLELTE